MAMCSKFGILDDEPEVGTKLGAKEGVRGAVFVAGAGTEVSVAEGLGPGATVVAGACVQAVNKIKIRREKIERFINLHVLL